MLVLVGFGIGVSRAEDAPEILHVHADDRPVPAQQWRAAINSANAPLELEPFRALRLLVRTNASDTKPLRLRHVLEGGEVGWRDASGAMACIISMHDQMAGMVGEYRQPIMGESAGWTGNPLTADLAGQTMAATVPPSACQVLVTFSTTNSTPATVGILAIQEVAITITSRDGARKQEFRAQPDGPEWPRYLVHSPGGWLAYGTQPTMVRIDHRENRSAMAVLTDERTDGFTWLRLRPPLSTQVAPGDRIEVAWRGCYSSGHGGDQELVFPRLDPGSYNLRIGVRATDGTVLRGETSLPLVVLPPWWRRLSTWLAAAGVALVLAATVARLLQAKRRQRQRTVAERHQAVDRERTRIARDIHDDLGACLAQIAMLGDRAQTAPAGTSLADSIATISQRARESMQRLRDIVWAVDPTYDSLDHLAVQIAVRMEEHLRLAGVGFRAELPEDLPTFAVDRTMRHQLLLAVRETVHNAVRHGAPTRVTLRLHCRDGHLTIAVTDDGRGCDAAAALVSGRGLTNLQARLGGLGGSYRFTSSAGCGATAIMSLPMAMK
jgi:signal transduction histidine kinase